MSGGCGLSTVEAHLPILFSEVCFVLISLFLVLFLLDKAAGEAKRRKKKGFVSALKTIKRFFKKLRIASLS